jgi:hypothetical protein
MTEETFSTPEEAATSDWDAPSRFLRVESVSYSEGGQTATVTLLTNEEPYLYPYYVHCVRDASGRWIATHDGN